MTDQTKTMLKVLGAASVLWFILTVIAQRVRADGGFSAADLDQAVTWGKALLGLAATLGGLLGLTKAAQDEQGLFSSSGTAMAEGGVVGLLAGATLLEVGDAAVPIGLAAFVVAGAAARFVRAIRGL